MAEIRPHSDPTIILVEATNRIRRLLSSTKVGSRATTTAGTAPDLYHIAAEAEKLADSGSRGTPKFPRPEASAARRPDVETSDGPGRSVGDVSAADSSTAHRRMTSRMLEAATTDPPIECDLPDMPLRWQSQCELAAYIASRPAWSWTLGGTGEELARLMPEVVRNSAAGPDERAAQVRPGWVTRPDAADEVVSR